MSRVKKLVSVLLVGLFSFSLVLSSGCTSHPNEEQIQMMEEARSACLAAEQKLSETQQERQQLEKQLSEKKATLEDLQQDKATIEQRASNWGTQE